MDKMDAFCERLIKGMETTNRKIEEKTSCWYAVYTAVKAEKSVKEQLDKAGIESYLPLQSIVRSWNNRKRKVMVPVIPGCVFVRLPMDEVTRIKSIKGISFLLREEGRYVSIPEDQMETFRSMVENTDELVEYRRIGIWCDGSSCSWTAQRCERRTGRLSGKRQTDASYCRVRFRFGCSYR